MVKIKQLTNFSNSESNTVISLPLSHTLSRSSSTRGHLLFNVLLSLLAVVYSSGCGRLLVHYYFVILLPLFIILKFVQIKVRCFAVLRRTTIKDFFNFFF